MCELLKFGVYKIPDAARGLQRYKGLNALDFLTEWLIGLKPETHENKSYKSGNWLVYLRERVEVVGHLEAEAAHTRHHRGQDHQQVSWYKQV